MKITKEMKEMMERTMEEYFAAYWEKHATPEQKEKRIREGKTFKGAYAFAKSVAMKYRTTKMSNTECVAMPDDVAYWILMEYMESVPEGETYRTDKEIEEAHKREIAEAERKRKELEKKAKKMNEENLIKVTPKELEEAEAAAKEAKRREDAIKESVKAEQTKANDIINRLESATQMSFL